LLASDGALARPNPPAHQSVTDGTERPARVAPRSPSGWLLRAVIAVGIAAVPAASAAGQAQPDSAGGSPRVTTREQDTTAIHPRTDETLPMIAAAVRERGVVDSALVMARRHLRLPKLLFAAESCGRPNAYYFAPTGKVVVCFEMLLDAYQLLNRHEHASL
jgi:hypothetical protein